MTTRDAALRLRGLTKAYAGRTVLDGLDLDVRSGELLALLGPNGCGKSTTLRCVAGLEVPDAGSVEVAAEQHGSGRPVAMVFQRVHLVPRRSVLDNVCAGGLGRLGWRGLAPALFPTALREEAMGCLDRVGLADRAHDRAGRLSGGQQQRVAVARALCQRAPVLLADEPVSALDPRAAEQVMSLLRDLARSEGLAVVAVLHQPALAARHADRTVGLRDGHLLLDQPAGTVSAGDLDLLYAGATPLEVAA